jgi:L-amino acid N-acyltransferase YncA
MVELQDIPTLCGIYNHYVEHTIATFEEVPIHQPELAHRIAVVGKNFPWLVYEEQGAVLGFAYGNYWKARSAYRFTLETTIYLDHRQCGRGIGRVLYSGLLDRLTRQHEAHRLLACISLPNERSVALHENLGFRKIGHFAEVGRKFDRWVDVGYWELRV